MRMSCKACAMQPRRPARKPACSVRDVGFILLSLPESGSRMRLVTAVITSCCLSFLLVACAQSSDVTPAKPTEPTSTSTKPPLTHAPPRLKVIGTEPFWNIDVDANRLHFTTMEDQVGQHLTAEPDHHGGDGWRWRSKPVGAFDLVIVPGKCSDGMSDREYAYSASFVLGQAAYSGCADVPEKFSGEGQQP